MATLAVFAKSVLFWFKLSKVSTKSAYEHALRRVRSLSKNFSPVDLAWKLPVSVSPDPSTDMAHYRTWLGNNVPYTPAKFGMDPLMPSRLMLVTDTRTQTDKLLERVEYRASLERYSIFTRSVDKLQNSETSVSLEYGTGCWCWGKIEVTLAQKWGVSHVRSIPNKRVSSYLVTGKNFEKLRKVSRKIRPYAPLYHSGRAHTWTSQLVSTFLLNRRNSATFL